MRISILSSAVAVSLVACGGGSSASLDPDAGPGNPGDGSGSSSGSGSGSGSDGSGGNPDGGQPVCQWHSTLVSPVTWTKTSNIALAVSSTGERAVMFTAALTNHRDLMVARATSGSYVTQPYGFTLLTNGTDDVSGAFAPDNSLRIAYSNIDNNSSTVGGVFYTPGPGTNVLIDDAGLFGQAQDPHIAISADARMHIAYSVNTPPSDRRIAVATGFDSTFSVAPAIVDSHLYGQVDLALDAAGKGHVASIQESGAGLGNVLYAGEGTSGWSATNTVTNTGGYVSGSSLAIGSGGAVQMTRIASDGIIHISGTPSVWQITKLSFASLQIPAAFVSLAAKVDGAGTIQLAWSDSAGKLWFETAGGGAPVQVAGTAQKIWDVSLVPGPGGPYIAYGASAMTYAEPTQIYVAQCQ